MAKHIRALTIKAFRGIKNLDITDLSDINIITGDNNTGKTSVLEVLRILEKPTVLFSLLQIGRMGRFGFSRYESLLNLFNIDEKEKIIDFSVLKADGVEHKILIQGETEQETLTQKEIDKIIGVRRDYTDEDIDIEEGNQLIDVTKINLAFELDGEVKNTRSLYDIERIRISLVKKDDHSLINNILYVSPFNHVEGTIYLTEVFNTPELYQEMLEVLREFDDNIISINADINDNNYINDIVYKILSKNHNEALPLNVYGDGMKKAVLLMSAIVKAKNGVLLLDEFETAIHTSAMNRIFNWIINTCIKLNVQLFLTSHSEEAIKKLLHCEPNLQNHIRVITLMKVDEDTKARVLTGTKAIQLENDYGMELR